MKIAFTSDIHFPITNIIQLRNHIQAIKNDNPDIVVIAGDIAESRIDHKLLKTVLNEFRQYFNKVLVLAGNHDLWNNKQCSTIELWDSFIEQSCDTCGCFYLEKSNYIVDDICFVGSYMHYDYSAKDTIGPCSSFSNKYLQINKGKINNDGNYMSIFDDIEFANKICEDFMHRLTKAADNPAIKKIVLVTHVPCLEEQMLRKPFDYNWSLGTPYFGNLTYQDIINKIDKIIGVISGHSHQKYYNKTNQREVFVIGADYKKPQHVCITI